jgi:hypothetical protein
MKHFAISIAIISMILLATPVVAQISADDERIVIIPYIPEQVFDLSNTVSTNLYNKLTSAITRNGLSGEGAHNRFVMSALINIQQKDVTATAPPMHVIEFDLTLYVGDGVDGVLFSSTNKRLKGVGRNETAAYVMALNNFEVTSKEVKELIEIGKVRIVQYYRDKCEIIIRESKTKASQDQFDEAIYALLEIPSVVTDCYQKAMDEAVRIHKLKLEKECQTNISYARGEMMQGNWSAAIQTISGYTPDLSCYKDVSKLLDEIAYQRCSVEIGKARAAWSARDHNTAAFHLAKVSSSSSCKSQADGLMKQISNAIDAKAKREWDLAYEKYNRDQVIREENSKLNRELSRREMSYKENQGFEVRKMEIQAARDVGVAYGKNQPRTVTYNIRNWW